jgi:hypothetical protein
MATLIQSASRVRICRSRAFDCRFLGLLAAAVLASAVSTHAAQATDLNYILQSPAFGGNNPTALNTAEFDKGLAQSRAATAAAAASAAAAKASSGPTQQFANAIISQLNSLVAINVAQQIANSHPGAAGTIKSGNVSVTYVNSDGQLNIVINTPAGSTTLSLPSGD